mgnify:CR=1 FL=1
MCQYVNVPISQLDNVPILKKNFVNLCDNFAKLCDITKIKSKDSLILNIINATTEEFKHIPSIDRTLASRYGQKVEDIQQWLSQTQWSQKNLDEKTVQIVQNQLFELNIISKKVDLNQIVKNI